MHVNNKGADQPVQSQSLISTFVICALDSVIAKLASCLISKFYQVSVGAQWLSGRVLDLGLRGWGSSLTGDTVSCL